MKNIKIRSTTILCVRRDDTVAIGGDGQVTLGNAIAKSKAVKIRRIQIKDNPPVLAGFAGGAADALALLEHFEKQLAKTPKNLRKAAIELAKLWRTDRMLRRLECMMIVADHETTLLISGQGDVIEPEEGILGIGSGGNFAMAAARALMRHTELTPEEIVKASMKIAGELCIYTNENTSIETLPE